MSLDGARPEPRPDPVGKLDGGLGAGLDRPQLLDRLRRERRTHFEQYGLNLGLAFQVHDDWLGIWGDPAVTGKSAASDLEQRKKSLPVVYGMEHSPEFATRYARSHAPGEPVAELAAQLDALGAQAYTLQTAQSLTEQATAHLRAAEPAGSAAEALWELTDSLLKRSA